MTVRQLGALLDTWPRVQWPTLRGRLRHVRRVLCRELVRRGALPHPSEVH